MRSAKSDDQRKKKSAKEKILKWVRKRMMNKESPLQFKRHVIKNPEVFSCSNLKKREGRRSSDLESSLRNGLKMQIARSKLSSPGATQIGYDNWIVWLKEGDKGRTKGKSVLEMWKPNSGDCIVIVMEGVTSVFCFDNTVILTNGDGEQFTFLAHDQTTMKQLQLIFKAATGDNDATLRVKGTYNTILSCRL